MSLLDNSSEEVAASRRGSNRETGDADRHKPDRGDCVTDVACEVVMC